MSRGAAGPAVPRGRSDLPMIPCTIQEICAAVGGTLLQDSPAAITGVTTDSRAVSAGQLFIPLTGERFDGHAYIDAALTGGAEAA